ncbi:MAG: DUF1330 domain-containing protein [Giesbergeria sp.]
MPSSSNRQSNNLSLCSKKLDQHKDPARWDEYRSRVPHTLEPWGAELVFRGTQAAVLSGGCMHPDIVVIRFPSMAAAECWFSSEAYQALIPIRLQAADVTPVTYAT